MTEEKKSFTVSDRRHFTPEGEARAAQETPKEAPPAPPPQKAVPSSPPPPRTAAPPSAAERGGGHALDFTGLLISLGTQAAMLLAGGDPAEGGPPPDPEGARAFISLLEVLQQKTEGRLSPEEEQVLEDLLYQLRMEYVSRTQVKGA
jgi:hypothetical protein